MCHVNVSVYDEFGNPVLTNYSASITPGAGKIKLQAIDSLVKYLGVNGICLRDEISGKTYETKDLYDILDVRLDFNLIPELDLDDEDEREEYQLCELAYSLQEEGFDLDQLAKDIVDEIKDEIDCALLEIKSSIL